MNTSPPIGASCPSMTVSIEVAGSNPTLYHNFVLPQTKDKESYFWNRANNPDYGRCGGVSYQAFYNSICNDGSWTAPNYSVSCNY